MRYELRTGITQVCAYDTQEERIVGDCLHVRYPASRGCIRRFVAKLNGE